MIDPTATGAALCLATGLACLVLTLIGVGDRASQLTHAAMGVTMAAMLSPWGDPLPAWAGIVGFSVLGAWFAAAVLRGDRSAATAQHLAISSAAMVVMYLMHGHHGAMPGMAGTGPHAGHVMGGGPSLVVMPVALVLAGYFVWHTWTCVDRARAATRSATGSADTGTVRTRALHAVRVEPVAHGVMSALMAAMFLGVV